MHMIDRDRQQPVLVESTHERKLVLWTIVAGVTAILTLIYVVVTSIFDPKQLVARYTGGVSAVWVLLFFAGVILLTIAGWLNLKAATLASRKARPNQLPSPVMAKNKALIRESDITLGREVRVKAHLTTGEKDTAPGWSAKMDACLGRKSVVKSINEKYGWVTLEDFPGFDFHKEWLETLDHVNSIRLD
jgi:hypothetical protein